MKGKFQKGISYLVTSLMTVSMFSAAPLSVQAKTNVEAEREKLMMEISKEYKKSLSQLKTQNKLSDIINNGGENGKGNSNNKEQYKPEDRVRVLIETEYKALKDYAKPNESLSKKATKSSVEKINNSKSQIKSELRKINPTMKVRRDYFALTNGFSAEVQYKDIEKIKNIKGVKHVNVANKYYFDMHTSKKMIKAEEAWAKLGGKGGEGVVVAIVDSGIHPEHKDMRLSDPSKAKFKKSDIDAMQWQKGKWHSEKIPYGYNFGDDSDIIYDKTGPTMHGMHVAGTVGANCESEEEIKKGIGVKGVAPEVQLLAMKVGSNRPGNNGAWGDDIAAAWEDAVLHGADVVNMSMGSSGGFFDPEGLEQKIIREAANRGVVPVLSQGNATYSTTPFIAPQINDYNTGDSPGNIDEAIAVAAIQNTSQMVRSGKITLGEETVVMGYAPSPDDPDPIKNMKGKFEVVDCGNGRGPLDEEPSVNDFEGKDVKGKIALIQRGGSTFIEKKLNAQAAGAIGAIIYNSKPEPGYINMASDPKVKIPSVFLTKQDGLKIKNYIAKAENKNVEFNFGNDLSLAHYEGTGMCDFSSWGPSGNLELKPQITAPGEFIWSTANPGFLNGMGNKSGYQNMQGTSMASPHIAGCMALITQHVNSLEKEGKIKFNNPREKTEFIKKLGVNTATVVLNAKNNNIPHSPRKQGAGLANVDAAVKNNVTVEYKDNGREVASLKEIGNKKEFTLKLHNYGDSAVTYNVEPVTDKIITGNEAYLKEAQPGAPTEVLIEGSSILIENSNTVVVEPGKDAEVKVTLTIPQSAPKDTFAEGFIRFTPKDSKEIPTIGIPFMGFYGKWDAKPNIDAPAWKEDSVFGITGLFTESGGDLVDLGLYENEKGQVSSNEDFNAISHEKNAFNTAGLRMFPFRNIKSLDVDILNEKGEVVKELAKNNTVDKIVLDDDAKHPFRLNPNWIWDGTSKKNEPVEDGQYTMRIQSTIEYEKAKPQTMTMKIKVDSEAPEVQLLKDQCTVDSNNKGILKFKAEDPGKAPSGIEGFAFIVNGRVYKQNGKAIFRNLEKDSKGVYSFEMQLPNNKINDIQVVAIDHANNIGISKEEVNKQALTTVVMKDGKEIEDAMQLLDGDFSIYTKINDSYEKKINKINILLDGENYKDIDVKDETREHIVAFKDVKPGDHTITLKALNNEEVLDKEEINIKVQANTLGFKMDTKDDVASTTDFVLKGSFEGIPDEFKINGEDVKLKGLKFEHPVKLEANKKNRIPIYIRKGDEVINYCHLIICDTAKPEINLDLPENSVVDGDKIVVKVPQDQKTFKLKGKITDNLTVFQTFINGVNQGESDTDVLSNKPYYLDKEIELTDALTIVKVEAVDIARNISEKTIRIQKDDAKVGEFKIESLNIKDSYKNGEQFDGGVKITNATSEGSLATLIIGLYNENNEMVNVLSAHQLVKAGETVDLSGTFNIPEKGNYTIRCFVWDSFESMIPLSEVIKAPVISEIKK